MADDGEIDIEGEFDFKLEVEDGFYDVNELPSKSANLLPEYTNPPWMLEQGWTLDMDEKSKATIEKMLLEEQHYINGKTRSKQSSVVDKIKVKALVPPNIHQNHSVVKCNKNKRGWTIEEKTMFLKGLDIFGRSWTKISELIPSRTTLQVKNYAQQYFKNLSRKKEMISQHLERNKEDNCSTDAISQVLSSVETGKPTIKTVKSPTRSQKTNAIDLMKLTQSQLDSNGSSNVFTNLSLKTKSFSEKISVNLLDSSTENSSVGTFNSTMAFQTELPNNVLSNMLIEQTVCYDDKADITVSTDSFDIVDINYKEYDHNSEDSNLVKSVKNSPTTATSESKEESDEDVDIDIENDDGDNNVLLTRSTTPTSVYEKLLQSARIDVSDCVDSDEEKDENEDKNSVTSLQTAEEIIANDNVKSEYASNCFTEMSRSNSPQQDPAIETKVKVQKVSVNGVISSGGELVEFPIPTSPVEINFDEISEVEQTIHSEFFDGRPSKTPDRYLKIRNHIIESWLKCRPVYLNKTSVRKGLKNCGDVNCIGRIHSYLECIGVINFGCEQALYNNLAKTQIITTKTESPSSLTEKLDSIRVRKRRIRDAAGEWVDFKDLEGKTIEHSYSDEVNTKPKINNSPCSKNSYDPFKLIPCQSFNEKKKAPYEVELSNLALIVMDIHAHISKTEVIGMLGGVYDQKASKLHIMMAVPCRSLSTGMQCEMDPVSQTQASEKISCRNLQVVGWYHSHPTFSPNPSIRDIETQIKFQDWFSQLGGGQFIGIIVSPYNRRNPRMMSQVQCLTISQEICQQLKCNIPFQFDYKIQFSLLDDDLLNTIHELAEQYATYNNQVILSGIYNQSSGISCLQKMLESIKQHLDDGENQEKILNLTFNIFNEKDIADKKQLSVDIEIVNIGTPALCINEEVNSLSGDMSTTAS